MGGTYFQREKSAGYLYSLLDFGTGWAPGGHDNRYMGQVLDVVHSSIPTGRRLLQLTGDPICRPDHSMVGQ